MQVWAVNQQCGKHKQIQFSREVVEKLEDFFDKRQKRETSMSK
jgi:hypothetical protein